MENIKNTTRSDGDEERERNEASPSCDHLSTTEEVIAPMSSEEQIWTLQFISAIDQFAIQGLRGIQELQSMQEPSPSLDDVLSDYVFPTPYLDEDERLRDKASRVTLEENFEEFSEYQILDSDEAGELEGKDSEINGISRLSLANDIQQPRTVADELSQQLVADESETALKAERKARHDCIWAEYFGSAYRKDKVQAYRNEGLSSVGASSQADVMFRARVLPVFEGRGTLGNPEVVAFLQEFPVGTLGESCELCRAFARDPPEEEELEPLIPKNTEDKVWEAWCVSFNLTSEQVADIFKAIPHFEESAAYDHFEKKWVSWMETLVAIGLSEVEASEKLREFCRWAKRKHKIENMWQDDASSASSSSTSSRAYF